MNDRKPLAPPMESRVPKSIRFTPSEWADVAAMAQQRGEEPSRLARKLVMYGLTIARAQAVAEAHTGILAGRLA